MKTSCPDIPAAMPDELRADLEGLTPSLRGRVLARLIDRPDCWTVPPRPRRERPASSRKAAKPRPGRIVKPDTKPAVEYTPVATCPHEGDLIEVWQSNCQSRSAARSLRVCTHPDGTGTCRRVMVRGYPAAACESCTIRPDRPKAVTAPPKLVRIDTWTRHLMFHVYPVSGNGAWQRNVSRLVERLRLFNGKIVVAIVVDPPDGRKADPVGKNAPDKARHFARCDTPETVKAAFGDWRDRIEFLVGENDPTLREVATLIPMLERLPNEPGHCCLYAQAKGTTRHPGHIAHHWSDTQYVVYLDYWRLVAEQLARFPVTGAFKKYGPGWRPEQSKSDWHYSGSWFWFRTADLFARDWRRVDQFWSGVEPYPSQHFFAAESGWIFHEGSVSTLNLYRPGYWRSVVNPALARWRAANARYFNATNGI